MKAQRISDAAWALPVDIDTADLFEGIWPIPEGVSLNSYLVKGEKIALIDLVREWTQAPQRLLEEIAQTGMNPASIDYLIVNHMEPDHTGWMEGFRAIAPQAQILLSKKALPLAASFYGITDGIRAVSDGETLDLGGGVILSFHEAPNVHWPETMVSYLARDGILFCCDAFGSFGKLGDRCFDDEFSNEEHRAFERESLRYYANIVSSYSTFVQRAIQKLSSLDIKVVAPSHGIIWRKNPKAILDRYARYAAYASGKAEAEVCVIWGSMYGNTEAGLKAVLRGIEAEGVPYSIHRVPDEDVSYVLADAWKSSAVAIGMPTYEYRMFPPMAYALDILARKHVFSRKAFRFGSFGWVGGAKKECDAMMEELKWDCMESVEWAGRADSSVLARLEEQGRQIARTARENALPAPPAAEG